MEIIFTNNFYKHGHFDNLFIPIKCTSNIYTEEIFFIFPYYFLHIFDTFFMEKLPMRRKESNKIKIVNMKSMEIILTNIFYRYGRFGKLSIYIK